MNININIKTKTKIAKWVTTITSFTCGSMNTVLNSVIYNPVSTGWHSHLHTFRKPWFMAWSMFLSMSLRGVERGPPPKEFNGNGDL
jgi:hypothetical protein